MKWKKHTLATEHQLFFVQPVLKAMLSLIMLVMRHNVITVDKNLELMAHPYDSNE
jgi:hypothetical protein